MSDFSGGVPKIREEPKKEFLALLNIFSTLLSGGSKCRCGLVRLAGNKSGGRCRYTLVEDEAVDFGDAVKIFTAEMGVSCRRLPKLDC